MEAITLWWFFFCSLKHQSSLSPLSSALLPTKEIEKKNVNFNSPWLSSKVWRLFFFFLTAKMNSWKITEINVKENEHVLLKSLLSPVVCRAWMTAVVRQWGRWDPCTEALSPSPPGASSRRVPEALCYSNPTQTHSDKDSFSYRAHLGKIHFKTSLDFWIFLLVKILAFVRSTELWLPRILMGLLTLLPALVWQYTLGSSLFRGRYVGTCRRQLVSAWLDTAGDVFPWCWSPTVFGT